MFNIKQFLNRKQATPVRYFPKCRAVASLYVFSGTSMRHLVPLILPENLRKEWTRETVELYSNHYKLSKEEGDTDFELTMYATTVKDSKGHSHEALYVDVVSTVFISKDDDVYRHRVTRKKKITTRGLLLVSHYDKDESFYFEGKPSFLQIARVNTYSDSDKFDVCICNPVLTTPESLRIGTLQEAVELLTS